MLSSSGFLIREHSPELFDRELSWLAFNRRSLYEVADSEQPVLERLLKLAQMSAALDEYFMVRVPLLKQASSGVMFEPAQLSFQRVEASVRSLVARQQAHFSFSLRPYLAKQGIHLLDYSALTDIQRGQLHRRFEDEIAPVLAPLITQPTDPIPDFSNLSLNLAVCLLTDENQHTAWVKVPRSLSRFMLLPGPNHPSEWLAIPLEQIIAAHLPSLWPEFEFQGTFAFRVTRSASLGCLTSETANLMESILESLQQRQQQGKAVRLEIVQTMPPWLRSRLISHLQLEQEDTYTLQGWIGLSDLKELARLPRADLAGSPLRPTLPEALIHQPKPSMLPFVTVVNKSLRDIFRVLKERDLLVHLPYHSFAATVEQFVAQAAVDPSVLTIKMTLYRTAGDAPIVRSLIAAAKAGKQVVVLVELTATLDEAINIHWAQSLEKAGAHVVYGILGLKTHTNLALVVRREANHIHQYAYIGTGDYLPNRPQPYEDLGLLTSRAEIGSDLNYLFNFLTGCSHQIAYQALIVAPGVLRTRLKELIEREAKHARNGQPARIIAKLNLLADPEIIDALYKASQAGVQIDLIVRSICRLRPGVPGLSDRIRVVSILGRYVEHSRVLYCNNAGQPEVWIGSADWTPQGLDEHVEVMAPIQAYDLITDIQQRLEYWLADNQNAWILQSDGRYIRRQTRPHEASFSAQAQFIKNATEQGHPVAS